MIFNFEWTFAYALYWSLFLLFFSYITGLQVCWFPAFRLSSYKSSECLFQSLLDSHISIWISTSLHFRRATMPPEIQNAVNLLTLESVNVTLDRLLFKQMPSLILLHTFTPYLILTKLSTILIPFALMPFLFFLEFYFVG